MTQLRHFHRRGAAAVSIVLVLVVIQLAVVTAAIMDARDMDATLHRAESAQAFYASDAGMQMAIRELMTGIDHDGDGSIGGISDDGDDSNDPRVGGASVRVARSDSPATLTSIGQHGEPRHRQVVEFSGSGGSGTGARVVYSRWPNHTPHYRDWTGSAWGNGTDTVNLGGPQHWAVIAKCPVRTETILAAALSNQSLRTSVATGTNWAPPVTSAPHLQTLSTRPFWLAYEQVSGRALLVYGLAGSHVLGYRIWNGSSWSNQSTFNMPLSDHFAFARLVPRPGTNQMMLVATDNSGRLAAALWNGSAFSNATALENNLSSTSHECVDAAWETGSSKCILVWGISSAERPRMVVWNGSSWGSVSNMSLLGSKARWVKLAADPSSNRVVLGILDENSRINASRWNGATFGPYVQLAATMPTTSTRGFDIAFESAGTRALIVYAQSGSSLPAYRTFNGTTWSSAQNGPSLGATPTAIQLTPGIGGHEIFVLAAVANTSLQATRWDNGSFGSVQELTPNVNGGNAGEPFMVATDEGGSAPTRIRGWSRQPPQ